MICLSQQYSLGEISILTWLSRWYIAVARFNVRRTDGPTDRCADIFLDTSQRTLSAILIDKLI